MDRNKACCCTNPNLSLYYAFLGYQVMRIPRLFADFIFKLVIFVFRVNPFGKVIRYEGGWGCFLNNLLHIDPSSYGFQRLFIISLLD